MPTSMDESVAVFGELLGIIIFLVAILNIVVWTCLGPYLMFRLSSDATARKANHRELMRALRDLKTSQPG